LKEVSNSVAEKLYNNAIIHIIRQEAIAANKIPWGNLLIK